MSGVANTLSNEEVTSLIKVAAATETFSIKLGVYVWEPLHDFMRVCESHRILQSRVNGLEQQLKDTEEELEAARMTIQERSEIN